MARGTAIPKALVQETTSTAREKLTAKVRLPVFRYQRAKTIKDRAKEVVEFLRSKGIEVVMLTGDRQDKAKRIAEGHYKLHKIVRKSVCKALNLGPFAKCFLYKLYQ